MEGQASQDKRPQTPLAVYFYTFISPLTSLAEELERIEKKEDSGQRPSHEKPLSAYQKTANSAAFFHDYESMSKADQLKCLKARKNTVL